MDRSSVRTLDLFPDRAASFTRILVHLREQSRKFLSPERNRARSVVVVLSVTDTGGLRIDPRFGH